MGKESSHRSCGNCSCGGCNSCDRRSGAGVAGYIAAGALKGAVIGGVIGAATGAAGGAVSHRISTGSWKGAGKAALNGAATGFMTGAIAGAVTGGAGRGIQTLRNTKVTTRSLPITSKRMSSVSRMKNGKVEQTRYYGIRKKATFDIDYSVHGNPKIHSNPHGHKIRYWKRFKRKGPINNIWWRLKRR